MSFRYYSQCFFRYRSITQQYYRKADGILSMYDITDCGSFMAVREWLDCVQVGRGGVQRWFLIQKALRLKCTVQNHTMTRMWHQSVRKRAKWRYWPRRPQWFSQCALLWNFRSGFWMLRVSAYGTNWARTQRAAAIMDAGKRPGSREVIPMASSDLWHKACWWDAKKR